ncbi:FAD-dependent monooxygenase [Adhaeribacter swui]|uniref:FAD-dependent monooxygenase n=1 Tax=Adhaeribacter swui TaxID=2086471 RepID=A0A7G7GAE0_9BACT|nr:FAD-dependent oxidoreductase [Adhaeribacter swui]QNF34124.1 FAD-dependent monooxygenase [Adhaeribacter swui]
MKNIIIIGGGLAGLVASLQLQDAGAAVTVIERKQYPFHRVCGEYISNEVKPFLQSLGVSLAALQPATIKQFMLSSPAGKTLHAPLDLGGFGVSRYTLDNYLYRLAQSRGVNFILNTSATEVTFNQDNFAVELSDGRTLPADLVIGCYGKRANLDRQFQRSFFQQRSPYIGVKYHIKTDFPKDLIALHNFNDGYAGISAIEDDKYCFCYLTTRKNLKKHGSIALMEQAELQQNPYIKQIFKKSEFLYSQPEVINEISFAPKSCLENHVLMCGDAAGLITPLCGNGMAMAIHGAKIVSDLVREYLYSKCIREQLEQNYVQHWQNQFARRLQVGRLIQGVFGKPILSEAAVATLKIIPGAVNFLIKNTHGKAF